MTELIAAGLLVGAVYMFTQKRTLTKFDNVTTQDVVTDVGLSDGFPARMSIWSEAGLTDTLYNHRMRDNGSSQWSDNWRGAWYTKSEVDMGH